MNFKKPKIEVIADAENAAFSALNCYLNELRYGQSYQQSDVINTLQLAISRAIGEAIRTVVESTYTDEEFEEDLQLKS
jgi:hypothetical protein